MKLTEDQLSKLSSVLKIKNPCPNCGATDTPNFTPDEYQLSSIDRANGSYSIGGPMDFIPLAALYCPKCGFLRLFNLKVLGVVNH